jgi:hypothetical protein
MTMVGLAKNEEELFFVGDQQSLKLPYDSESHKLIRGSVMKCTALDQLPPRKTQ